MAEKYPWASPQVVGQMTYGAIEMYLGKKRPKKKGNKTDIPPVPMDPTMLQGFVASLRKEYGPKP